MAFDNLVVANGGEEREVEGDGKLMFDVVLIRRKKKAEQQRWKQENVKERERDWLELTDSGIRRERKRTTKAKDYENTRGLEGGGGEEWKGKRIEAIEEEEETLDERQRKNQKKNDDKNNRQ